MEVGMWAAAAPSRALWLLGLSSHGQGPRAWLGSSADLPQLPAFLSAHCLPVDSGSIS